MKLPNSTKKWEMRATLNTIIIMSLIKREMKFRISESKNFIRSKKNQTK
jgi:hypothetical protein